MTDQSLDLSPLERAIARLDEGWARYQRDISDTQIRDGLIHRLKFTFEISRKMLKRYLEFAAATPAQYDEMAFPDLIRSGNEQGLLRGTWPDWKHYRDMRAKTSHSYNENVALEVVANIPAFLAEASELRDRIKARLA